MLVSLVLISGLAACDRREKLPDKVEYIQQDEYEVEKDALARFGRARFTNRAYKPRTSTRNEIGYTNSGKEKKSRNSRAPMPSR